MTLQQLRAAFIPKIPRQLTQLTKLIAHDSSFLSSNSELEKLFPHLINQAMIRFVNGTEQSLKKSMTVGILFSGGQAAGGHNVVTGLFDALKTLHPDCKVIGFKNGPSGLVNNQAMELTAPLLDSYRNQGGFDLIGSGRTKIETDTQFAQSLKTVQKQGLDGLVIVGGDDSNTNAAFLAEYFLTHQCSTKVIGVPKTIDGDLKNEFIEISFGFDTAAKTYAEIIGNIMRDALSAKKYYYFIKLMGRTASHLTLECALKTHPNVVLIGEEVAEKKQSLKQLVVEIADVIEKRSKNGKDYGVILIPEGIVEFVPEFKQLISELNHLLAQDITEVEQNLSDASKAGFKDLPESLKNQLLEDRDPHGNVQVSKIETERLFIYLVEEELKKRNSKSKLSAQPLFCGYEGRSAYPSNFDAQYCYALGMTAALLLNAGKTGYMACIQRLTAQVEDWEIGGVPLIGMMVFETRKGKQKAVIQKALVDTKSAVFQEFSKKRAAWALEDDYLFPGPIQFFGPSELTDSVPVILQSNFNTK